MNGTLPPTAVLTADKPLAAEALEHWAAKLVVRGAPGDAELAQEVQAQAQLFRQWRKDNPA